MSQEARLEFEIELLERERSVLREQICKLEDKLTYMQERVDVNIDRANDLRETFADLNLHSLMDRDSDTFDDDIKEVKSMLRFGAAMRLILNDAEETPVIADAWKKFLVAVKIHGHEDIIGNIDASRT